MKTKPCQKTLTHVSTRLLKRPSSRHSSHRQAVTEFTSRHRSIDPTQASMPGPCKTDFLILQVASLAHKRYSVLILYSGNTDHFILTYLCYSFRHTGTTLLFSLFSLATRVMKRNSQRNITYKHLQKHSQLLSSY